MKLKNLVLAAIAGSAAILSAPVFADGRWDHGHDRGWHGGRPVFVERHAFYPQHHYYYYAPPRVVYAPPRVVYAPPAVVYPAPQYSQYYAAPAAVYQPPVVASPGVSIRFHLPL